MDNNMNQEVQGNNEETFEKVVRAGKRTYFLDVRATKNNDHYITITESKKRFNDAGKPFYQKHKIFLYKEDFEKFATALNESIDKVIELNAENDQHNGEAEDQFSNLSFEDLEVKK